MLVDCLVSSTTRWLPRPRLELLWPMHEAARSWNAACLASFSISSSSRGLGLLSFAPVASCSHKHTRKLINLQELMNDGNAISDAKYVDVSEVVNRKPLLTGGTGISCPQFSQHITSAARLRRASAYE